MQTYMSMCLGQSMIHLGHSQAFKSFPNTLHLSCSEAWGPPQFWKNRAPQKGPENWCRAKIVETSFDTSWRFWTFFALREKCRKVSKIFLTLFGAFWRFLLWPLSAGPFCGPLKKEALSEKAILGATLGNPGHSRSNSRSCPHNLMVLIHAKTRFSEQFLERLPELVGSQKSETPRYPYNRFVHKIAFPPPPPEKAL